MTKHALNGRRVSRRWLLAGVPVAAVAIAGCGSSTSNDSASTSASASTTSTVDGEAAAGSVAALAQAFYKTLDNDQQAGVLFDYSLSYAKRWSNLPQGLLGGGTGGAPGGTQSDAPSGGPGGNQSGGPGGAPSGAPIGNQSAGTGGNQARVGISLSDLDDDQLAAFRKLLKAATGSRSGLGYAEIQQHLNADDYLADHGGGDDYGRANFYIAILGSPQGSGTWEFQFGGHHLAVANTYTNGKLAGATPSFRGIEPNAAFRLNGKTNQPMKVKEAAFTAMLAALSTDQRATAKLADTYSDLVLGPGHDWAFPTTKEGLQVSALSANQKALVLAAIAAYVNDIADDDAAAILARYKAELDDTYIAYSGTLALTERNDYVRIDGPSVWIEFSMQNGIVLSGNHPHSVWRDRSTDYGGTKS